MPKANESLPDRHIMDSLDAIKKVTNKGTEYWLARQLQSILGYSDWRNFAESIKRAKQACESSGGDPSHHFADINTMMVLGKGAQRKVPDFALTRYAAYLTAMNGDPAKPEIAAAQAYFAVQTRRQEVSDQKDDVENRIALRDRVKNANKYLVTAAKKAGVQNYGLFHDAGYKGLYDRGLADIKAHKGLDPKEELLDRAGRAELAANEFRITQTEQTLIRQQIVGDQESRETHREVGREVRRTIEKLGGTMPEDMKPEPSIKKIRSARKRKELPEGS